MRRHLATAWQSAPLVRRQPRGAKDARPSWLNADRSSDNRQAGPTASKRPGEKPAGAELDPTGSAIGHPGSQLRTHALLWRRNPITLPAWLPNDGVLVQVIRSLALA